MPVFKRFGPGDQVDNVLVLQPKYDLVSGSAGWRGGPHVSGSVSLYGGLRRSPADVVTDIRYQSTFPGANQFGQPTLGMPLTASVRAVWMTNEELPLAQRTDTRWGREHWTTVQRLYDDYRSLDPDYVTGTYDAYSLYFQESSLNMLAVNGPTMMGFPTGSWTFETWINPLKTSTGDRIIASIGNSLVIAFLSNTTRVAAVANNAISVISTGSISTGSWTHLCVQYNASLGIASILFNQRLDAVGTFQALIDSAPNTVFSLGNQSYSTTASIAVGTPNGSFTGLIGSLRFWSTYRTSAQLSASANVSLTDSAASGALYSFPFREGPLYDFGDNNRITPPPIGSGSINHAVVGAGLISQYPSCSLGYLRDFGDRVGPVWVPTDNTAVTFSKRRSGDRTPVMNAWDSFLSGSGATTAGGTSLARSLAVQDLSRMSVIHVPSAFYGRSIARESLRIVCNAYSQPAFGLIRTLIDDGRGNLFISGSIASGSIANYRGVEWNKVGNVFYNEGLIVIKDPTLLDFGRTDGAASVATDTLQLSFRGDSRVPVKTLMCRIDRGEFNASLNPTFRTVDDDGMWERRHPSGTIRVTTVGLYNSDRELVGVARLAEPVRLRPRDRINIKLRMDF